VFSPYYALARRRGAADPADHVAINVGIYGRGGAWTMTERGRTALRRDADSFAVGPSRMSWNAGSLVVDVEEIAAPLPRRVRGRIRLDVPFVNARTFPLDEAGRHLWRPVAPVARIAVDLDRPGLSWAGSGYFDHNRGDEPLEDGFRSWTWTRASHGDGTDVAFATDPRRGAPTGFAAHFSPDGALRVDPSPPPVRLPRSRWAVPRAVPSEQPETARVVRTLLDTPFYARSLVTTTLFGRTTVGFHESLDLDRFRTPVVQAMLPFRMPRRGRSSPPAG
jgi:carotenoid 1,2-hydratase